MNYPQARLWLLLIGFLLSCPISWAQDSSVGLIDPNLVMMSHEQDNSRAYLLKDMHRFAATHGLHLLITFLEQDGTYERYVRRDETSLLSQSAPTLVITTWHSSPSKSYQRCEVQVNEALAARLPQSTAQQLAEKMLDYYGSVMIPSNAMYSGLSAALLKLGEYLNALPPPEAVPTITFANAPAVGNQPVLGLDAFTYEVYRPHYEQVRVNEEPYPVAWKALPSGGTTSVLAQVEKGVSFPPGVVFRQDGNTLSSQPATQNHQQQLTLTGQMHEQEGSLEVYASREEDAVLVGKLRTISYDVLYKRLVLVVPDDVTSDMLYLDRVSQKVQATLAQAGVSLTIEIQKFDTEWVDRDVPLEDETSGMLSNYPKELKRVIKDYRQEHDEEAETAYIFLAGSSSTGKLGYMPKKRPYGFVYRNAHYYAKEVAKTIAHELGHGLFRLEHTFEAYPALTKGSTDNLMDYGKGTRLHKYQWDLVHDPKAMLGWFQDDEENADMTFRQDVEWIVELYSPYLSKLFITAFDAKNKADMKKWINQGLKTSFSQEQVGSLGAVDKLIPRKKDGSVPVAIIKHYPNAKIKGLYVYYTERDGVTVKAADRPRAFTKNLPVDTTLYTGEFDKIKATVEDKNVTKAFGDLAYDFVWKTMSEQNWTDQAINWMKEAWAYPNVGRNDKEVNSIMATIAKTKARKSYKYSVEEKVVYTYGFSIDSIKLPLALYILEDNPILDRSNLIELTLSEKRPYALLGFYGKERSKIRLLVQVKNEHVELVKNYFIKKDDNVLADGTLLGDPFANLSIVPSGTYEKEGGRFGCTRTSSHSPLCKTSKHSYVTPRGVGVGNGGRLHSGIDIYAAIGTNLHTILKGKITSIDEIDDSGTGITVIVKSEYNGQSIYLKYCHLSEISDIAKKALKKNSLVEQGAIIGKTGNTGNAKQISASRYHVHIEASTDGVFYGGKTRVDPEIYIKTKFDSNHEAIK